MRRPRATRTSLLSDWCSVYRLAPIHMTQFSGPLVAASSGQAAALQSGPPQPVGTVRLLVLLSAERSARWGALSLHRHPRVTGDRIPERASDNFMTPGDQPGKPKQNAGKARKFA